MSNHPGQMPPTKSALTVTGVDYGKGEITLRGAADISRDIKLVNHDDVFKFDRCCQVTLWYPPPHRSLLGRVRDAFRGIAYGWRGWL